MVDNKSQFEKEDRRRERSSDDDKARADVSKAKQVPSEDDDLDFVVTETGAEQRDFVGGPQQVTSRDENLDIETNAGSEANPADERPTRQNYMSSHSEPIGMSEPPPPPGADDSMPSPEPLTSAPHQKDQTADAAASRDLPKLSEAEIRSIREKMYGQSNGLSDREKADLLKNADKQERPLFKNEPIVPPKKKADQQPARRESVQIDEFTKQVSKPRSSKTDSTLPRPQMAPSERGIAFFFRNFIELAGRHELTPGENLSVNGRDFELKAKTIDPKILYGSAAVLGLILLIFIGAFFINDPTGEGQLMGVVLDADDRPFIQEASVRFPELGRTIKSNAQGFFSLGSVAEGSYKIQYLLDDKIVGEDYATVVNGEVTLVALRHGSVSSDEDYVEEPVQTKKSASASQSSDSRATQVEKPTASAPKQSSSQSKSSSTTAKAKSGPGNVKLLANIEGAKFQLDGRTLGAGNITYSKINSGRRKYEISAAGYQNETGWVDIEAGNTVTLKVVLAPMEIEDKLEQFSAKDFYRSALNALKENRNETAITDFTHAVDADPGYADAYNGRAEAFANLKEITSAHNDFIRAAEIFTVQKQYGSAITAYNRALAIDPKSLSAYLGRGNLYLIQGQDIAAITDFDVARDIDDENPHVYVGLGKARYNQQNYKKAIDYFKKARKYNESDPVPHQYLMLSYLAIDKIKDVQKSYEKFKEVASESQLSRLQKDSRYTAVMAVIEEK